MRLRLLLALLIVSAMAASAQPLQPAAPTNGYGEFRANNDLLSYRLHVRVDPVAKSIKGSNVIRFKMLSDSTRIQLDLTEQLSIDRVTFRGEPAQFLRDGDSFFVDAPILLRKGKTYEIEVAYSGVPKESGAFWRHHLSQR